jgi:excisionase family DNA binding protein
MRLNAVPPIRKLPDGKNFDELRCLTLQKSAELPRISTRTLRGMIQLKELPAISVGHQWRIHKKQAYQMVLRAPV